MQQEVALTIYVDCWLKLSLNSGLHLRRLKRQEIQILQEIGVWGSIYYVWPAHPLPNYIPHEGPEYTPFIVALIHNWVEHLNPWKAVWLLTLEAKYDMKGASMEMWPLISKRWCNSRGTEAMRQLFTTKGHQMDTFAMKGTKEAMVLWEWGLTGKKTLVWHLALVAKCLELQQRMGRGIWVEFLEWA